MDLTFERGDPQQPKGHAIIYFRINTEPDKVYATYVIILPVKADLGKYVPPFLASHLGNMPLNDLSAFAMPPLPEAVDSYEELDRLSRMRDDDLAFVDSMFSFDLPRMMESVTEAVQAYSELCERRFTAPGNVEPEALVEPPTPESEEDRSFHVNEVLFSLMSEKDKLAELARLLGRLRFAVEGWDASTVDEVSQEITTLARHLPEEFRVPSLLVVAKDSSQRGSMLAQLYLDRCFRLSDGDVSTAQNLADQIQSLESEG
jgi:hypothetical protein